MATVSVAHGNVHQGAMTAHATEANTKPHIVSDTASRCSCPDSPSSQ